MPVCYWKLMKNPYILVSPGCNFVCPRKKEGLANGLTGDLLAVDLRTALHHLGMLTGSISSHELLGNIFANFCIGK